MKKTKIDGVGTVSLEWDLKKHFYTNENDPQIEKDLQKAERAVHAFVKKYAGKNFVRSERTLLTALKDYEKLQGMPELSRAARYFGFRLALNTGDHTAEKKENLLEDRMTKLGNELLFFTLAIGKIPARTQKKYLKSSVLAPYAYFLSRVFLEAKHTRTEAEERIINLFANTSLYMWISGTEKIVSTRTIIWKKKEIALPEAFEMIDVVTPREKQKLWNLILDALEAIAPVAENEFNAIATRKKVSDELRGYEKPYSATVQGYENEESSVLALVDAVSTKGFALSKKFYKIKAAYQKKTKIPYPNKYDPIGKSAAIPFERAAAICRDAFYSVNKEYGKIFDRMLKEGQIDVYPKRGKRGGAFMSSTAGLPTFVMLNHTDTFKALEVVAHEVGHAIHAERSKGQPVRYQDFSTVTAETASTLFEQLVGDTILENATDKEKLVLLHDRIGRDIATIQRQIAFFNFELDMHTTVRTHGAMTKEELQKMLQKHLSTYLGPAVDVTERDGLSYVYVSHFRYGFYVYSYAYGILASRIMATRFKEDPSYGEKIDAFLSAGGSDTVENLFASIDIDVRKKETFLESLASLEKDIKLFEKLVKRK